MTASGQPQTGAATGRGQTRLFNRGGKFASRPCLSHGSDFSEQQYGIVALGFEDKPATYTGADAPGWKGDLRGYGVSVQGNILTDERVLRNALAAFREAAKDSKTSLAYRLLAALEAGTKGGGGDRRCGEQRARSAFIVVESATPNGKTPFLLINVTGQEAGPANPVGLLRRKYDGQ